MLFHQGNVDEGQRFLDRFWPEARAVSDAELWFFGRAGLGRGTIRQLIGPRVWIAGARALARGNTMGKPVGDSRIMPAMLLVEGDRVLWRHEYAHAGDRPDLDEITRCLAD